LRECENTLEFFSSAVFGFEFTKESARSFLILESCCEAGTLIILQEFGILSINEFTKTPTEEEGKRQN
jgi:hypothetical protein